MSEIPAFIEDGYTQDGYVNGVPRGYPAVRFSFRPVLAQNRAAIYKELDNEKDARRAESIAAALVCKQIVKWDLVHKEKIIDITPSNVLRLRPVLAGRLFRIVMGDVPPDEDPNVAATDRDTAANESLARALNGEPPEEADVKN